MRISTTLRYLQLITYSTLLPTYKYSTVQIKLDTRMRVHTSCSQYFQGYLRSPLECWLLTRTRALLLNIGCRVRLSIVDACEQ